MAEITQSPLSNVTKQHAATVEYPFSPLFLSELEPFDREAHFGKPKEIVYPPVSDELLSAYQHDPKEPPAKEHGKPSPLPPVIGIQVKKSSTVVIREAVEQSGGGSRGAIKEISKSAIKNAVEILTNAEPDLNSMVVLTYPDTYPTDGRIVKAHLKAMRQAIERRCGEFEYFAAVEYQRRGAPHIHMAVSVDLAQLGEVISLRRSKGGRRKPAFQTVQEPQDWLFNTWIDVISKPNPAYNGKRLDWAGISQNDANMANKAYSEHNAGVSWEVMRDLDGAKKYFVKELSGLKDYQKIIPPGFTNPGRHFLYSNDMRFDESKVIEFRVNEAELRKLLEMADWEYIPRSDRPLFKRLWNSADKLLVSLIDHGFEPIRNGIEQLRRYADLRMQYWTDKAAEGFRFWAQEAELQRWIAGVKVDKARLKKIVDAKHREFVFSQEPLGP